MTGTWEWFREMDRMRREMDRLFDGVGFGPAWRPFQRYSFLPGSAARSYPLVKVSEDADAVYVQALAPGMNPESLQIQAVRNQLTISGEKAPSAGQEVRPEAYHRSERAAGRFIRSFTLPAEVEQEKAEAEYKNGLLRIKLPKAETAKPRQITVKVA